MSLRAATLSMLRQGMGDWVSGETLAESLNVSRTAIWKQIKKLQEDGYSIESASKKGYRLLEVPDVLSPDEVCPGLQTEVFGRVHYIYLEEVGSTNTYARELAASGYPEGTVVVAESQTAGRGRRGRAWHAPLSEGICVSLLLRPKLPLKEISRISLVTAAAVAQMLETQLGLTASIKWPNDIQIRGKKIAGILTEGVTDMDGVEYIVAGIGLNVNIRAEQFPEEFRDRATSVLAELGRPYSRGKLLQSLLAHFESSYQLLLAGGFGDILKEVRKRSTVIGHEVHLDAVNGFVTGLAVDIDDNGFLVVRDDSGAMQTVMSGEIEVIP
ncbi:MAG: biotin--[acetyl-CoA-carboxylase] ligase [Methylocystaceae bacterium]